MHFSAKQLALIAGSNGRLPAYASSVAGGSPKNATPAKGAGGVGGASNGGSPSAEAKSLPDGGSTAAHGNGSSAAAGAGPTVVLNSPAGQIVDESVMVASLGSGARTSIALSLRPEAPAGGAAQAQAFAAEAKVA